MKSDEIFRLTMEKYPGLEPKKILDYVEEFRLGLKNIEHIAENFEIPTKNVVDAPNESVETLGDANNITDKKSLSVMNHEHSTPCLSGMTREERMACLSEMTVDERMACLIKKTPEDLKPLLSEMTREERMAFYRKKYKTFSVLPSESITDEKAYCCICGKSGHNITPKHISTHHGMKIDEYLDLVGLKQGTKLYSNIFKEKDKGPKKDKKSVSEVPSADVNSLDGTNVNDSKLPENTENATE